VQDTAGELTEQAQSLWHVVDGYLNELRSA